MKCTRHIRPPAAILALSLFLLLCFASTVQAATMPEYERFQPITTALYVPTALALDASENVYVTESSNNWLLVYDRDGRYIKTLAGLDRPISVAVSSDGGIFIGNAGRGNVEVYNADSALLYKLGKGDGEFIQPGAIAIDSAGNVYVADSKGDKIKVYDPEGSYRFSFGTPGNTDGQLNFPTSLSINEQKGEIVISDLPVVQSSKGLHQGARIQVFDVNGNFKRSFGTFGLGEGKLIKPVGVTADEDGRVYVTDAYQNVVQVFGDNGAFLGTIYDQDSPMRTPLGVAFGKRTSRLFVVSLNTARVEVYGINVRVITASAGSGGTISPSGTVYVRRGTSQTFTITPDKDHLVADVRVDGSSVGEVTAYTFANVIAVHTIEATFIPMNPEPDIDLVGAEQTEGNATGGDSGIYAGLFGAVSLLKVAAIVALLIVAGVAIVIKRKTMSS